MIKAVYKMADSALDQWVGVPQQLGERRHRDWFSHTGVREQLVIIDTTSKSVHSLHRSQRLLWNTRPLWYRTHLPSRASMCALTHCTTTRATSSALGPVPASKSGWGDIAEQARIDAVWCS